MNQKSSTDQAQENLFGILAGITAFLIWGLSPIYWKELQSVPAVEVILHRIVWSFILLMPVIIFRHRFAEFIKTISSLKSLLILAATSIIVSVNWLTYIWAVQNGYILQASLGYYINPLVNVLLGMSFLGERFRRMQVVSLIIAGGSVLYLTFFYGEFPWISLILGFSFGFYGLIRKVVEVGSLVGLGIETFLLSIPAGIYLIFLHHTGTGSFLNSGSSIDLFLLGAAVVTAVPLLLFTFAARRLNLSTVGFMQYIGPTCMFLLSILIYKEPINSSQVITFVGIWIALVLYSIDSVIYHRKQMIEKSGSSKSSVLIR